MENDKETFVTIVIVNEISYLLFKVQTKLHVANLFCLFSNCTRPQNR